jgi:signal transduction histidine kinase
LERIFFHDILNLASNIVGFTELIRSGFAENRAKYEDLLALTADNLVREINAQKMLASAENGDLIITPTLVESTSLIQEVVNQYKEQRISKNRNIRISDDVQSVQFMSDKNLLLRVLANLIKNAVESIQMNETVTVGCYKHKDSVEIWVQNPGEIQEEARLQIFQRSFSTKGRDRGLGTYSIKLLSERYLQGKVSFETSEEKGTTFRLCYPLTLNLEHPLKHTTMTRAGR